MAKDMFQLQNKTFSDDDITNYQPPDFIPKTNAQYLNAANFSLRCLNELLDNIKWESQEQIKQFCFIYYNIAKVVFGAKNAYDKILYINSSTGKPIPLYEINKACLYSDNAKTQNTGCKKGAYPFRPSEIPKKLGIPDDLAKTCGFFVNEQKKEQRAKNRALKQERNNIIIDLYFQQYSQKEIHQKLVSQGYQCHLKTLNNFIRDNRLSDFNSFEQYKLSISNYDFPSPAMQNLYNEFITLTANANPDEQKIILTTLLNTNENVIIVGQAGTGKTTLLQEFMKSSPKEVVCCTPTGLATTNYKQASTLHSFFNLAVANIYDDTYDDTYVKPCPALRKVDAIIIDEVSMLRIDLFETIIKIIDVTCEKYNRQIQIILCGDFTQLPPVIKSEYREQFCEKYGKKLYCFQSNIFASLNFNKLVLNYVHRQNDQTFINILNRVKYCDKSVLKELITFFDQNEVDDSLYICARNSDVKQINDTHAAKYLAENQGYDFDTSEGKIQLACGMPIIITQNRNPYYQNGQMGTIIKIKQDKYIIVKLTTNKVVKIKYCKSKSHPNNLIIPIQRAYAITIHKCQGQTFNRDINILLSKDIWSSNLLYVALSRATNKDYIHLVNNNLSNNCLRPIKTNIDAIKYMYK